MSHVITAIGRTMFLEPRIVQIAQLQESQECAGRHNHHVLSTGKSSSSSGYRQQAKGHRGRGPDVRQCLVKGHRLRPSSCLARAAGRSVQRPGGRAGADAAIRAACRGRCPGGIRGAMSASSRLSAGESSQESSSWREEEARASRNELSGGMKLPIDHRDGLIWATLLAALIWNG